MKKKNNLIQVLSPYGNLPHPKGLQVLNKESALKMAKNFPSYLRQKFFKKIPIYVGHPDETQKKSKLKSQIVGYIEKIIPLDDGIAVLCTYDEIHYEKILKKELHSMSPRWRTLDLGNGTFMPIELISVGLTNEPNIDSSGDILSPTKLSYQQECLEKNLLKEKSLSREISLSIQNSKNCINQTQKIKNIQDSLTESLSKKLISSALNKGAISASECHKWTNDFKEKYQETKQKLIKTSTQKEEHSLSEIVNMTRQKMQEKSLSWDNAFLEVKRELQFKTI